MKIYKYVLGALGTNCYLAVDEATNEAVIIDPADDADKLLRVLADKSAHLCAILLTHAHFDHVMALEELRQRTGAPLLLHADEAYILHDNRKNLFARFSSLSPVFAPAERLLQDGETIAVGKSLLRVCYTPGHTPGSICLFDDASETVISGDTLFRESIGRYDFPDGDYDTLMASLRKLIAACGERDFRIFSGHGPSTHISHELSANLYLN